MRARPLSLLLACLVLGGCELLVNPDPTLVPGFYGVDGGYALPDTGVDAAALDGASLDGQSDASVDRAAPVEGGAELDSGRPDAD
jgi:hypothetical protein